MQHLILAVITPHSTYDFNHFLLLLVLYILLDIVITFKSQNLESNGVITIMISDWTSDWSLLNLEATTPKVKNNSIAEDGLTFRRTETRTTLTKQRVTRNDDYKITGDLLFNISLNFGRITWRLYKITTMTCFMGMKWWTSQNPIHY